jgi:glycosyltransferase involved in cell wall biosynthesis
VRILQFCNYADRVGGAEVYAHALVSALRARGHEVALFGASPGAEIDRPGLRVIQRPAYDAGRLVQDPAALGALREYVQRFRPEVVHAHNLYSVALEVVAFLGSTGVPLLHTVHDFQLLCPNSWCVRGDGSPCPGGAGAQCFLHGCQANSPYDSWDVLLAALRQRLAAHGADIALAPSSYLADRLRALGWPEVRHLPYFIDFPPGPQAIPRDEHELLYVGRLQREKGVDVLLEAMPQISRAIPEVRLTLAGSGTELPSLKQSAQRKGLAHTVRFLEAVPRDRLGELYARATLCILPSLWSENSPLVAYECLQSGLPMVGSRIGGIPELIEPDCGITFTPRDPRDLAAKVIRLLRLPKTGRAAMSEAARARSRSFDMGAHLDILEGAYAELLSRPPRHRGEQEFSGLLPVLAQVAADLAPGKTRWSLMERTRRVAGRLGLPKLFPRP